MQPDRAGKQARDHVAVPWDDVRAARMQRRVISALRGHQRPAWKGWRRTALLAAAALVVLSVLAIGVRGRLFARRTQLQFADGSTAVPESSTLVVPVLVSDGRVEVDQSVGVATYSVTPRASRAFLVRAGSVTVQVLGTAFRVERTASAVRVIVQRGNVRVSRELTAWLLGQGEEITVAEERAPIAGGASSLGGGSGFSEPPLLAPAPSLSAEAAPASASAEGVGPMAAELFRQADDARRVGDTGEAIRLLRELIQRYPRDGRVVLAQFTIGRLEAQRGRHAEAARAFESCGQALGGEALAEAAISSAAAGQHARASALARRYLATFPKGPRAADLSNLAP